VIVGKEVFGAKRTDLHERYDYPEKLHQVREAARQAEAVLREQLAAQGIELAQARTRTEALAASVEALQGRIDDEKASHEQTRRMLAEALISKSAAKGDSSARRRRKS